MSDLEIDMDSEPRFKGYKRAAMPEGQSLRAEDSDSSSTSHSSKKAKLSPNEQSSRRRATPLILEGPEHYSDGDQYAKDVVDCYASVYDAVLTTLNLKAAGKDTISYLDCYSNIMGTLTTVRKSIERHERRSEFVNDMRRLTELNGPDHMLILNSFRTSAMRLMPYSKIKMRIITMKVLVDTCRFSTGVGFNL